MLARPPSPEPPEPDDWYESAPYEEGEEYLIDDDGTFGVGLPSNIDDVEP
ncbi:hypothetical protein [Salinactinospora qingdaonensis]|uniref:Uncharacterized protein n=1 Tax=Salinactinospora qingdaonensis TaxID=702744 RepID=A0ABP7GD75_9ACTN